MTNTIQPLFRLQAFPAQERYLSENVKTETLDQLLARTAKQIKKAEKKGEHICSDDENRPYSCTPFKNAKMLVNFIATAGDIIPNPEGGKIRSAIFKLLNEHDAKDFKAWMKTAVKLENLDAADQTAANSLIDAYEIDIKELARMFYTAPTKVR